MGLRLLYYASFVAAALRPALLGPKACVWCHVAHCGGVVQPCYLAMQCVTVCLYPFLFVSMSVSSGVDTFT